MFKNIVIIALAIFLLNACSKDGNGEQVDSPHVDLPVLQPEEEVVIQIDGEASSVQEESVTAATEVPTETPSAEPENTSTLEPTESNETNPYVGVWTIEDMPFSLELRDDHTYLITVSERETEGVYTIDANRVYLSGDGDHTVTLLYFSNADIFKVGDFKLIRDDLVFYFDYGGVSSSFQSENDDLAIRVFGPVVQVKAKSGKTIQSYCFTGAGLVPPENSHDWFDAADSGMPSEQIRVYKYDGEYTLWTRDAEGNMLSQIDVTVKSGFDYPINGEGLDCLRQPLKKFLRDRSTNVDELNRTISRNVIASGIYTRAGAVTAGVSLISALSKYGYSVGYQENGSYQAVQDWGVDPKWGAKLGEQDEEETDEDDTVESFVGMSSDACIVWAYKQAGLNLCTDRNMPIETLGESETNDDNRISVGRAAAGDIIKQEQQYMMVVDRIDENKDGEDDAYLVFQMQSPILTLQILPFSQMLKHEVYAMDAFFNETGRNTIDVMYWSDTFRIPDDEFPMYLQETIETERTRQAFVDLLEMFGI